MSSFKYVLFLGFPIEPVYQSSLDATNPHAVSLFIRNDSDYLHEVTKKGVRYLGKKLGDFADLSHCELIEANIYSLLQKLVPDYSYDKASLVLLPIEES